MYLRSPIRTFTHSLDITDANSASCTNHQTEKNIMRISPAPKGLSLPPPGPQAATPLGLRDCSRPVPRVARSSQPWAGGRNPFGIGNSDWCFKFLWCLVLGAWCFSFVGCQPSADQSEGVELVLSS